MVTPEEFVEKIKETLELPDANVELRNQFRELPDWSSMHALMIIAMFETDFDVTVTGEDLRKAQTVQDLYNLLPR